MKRICVIWLSIMLTFSSAFLLIDVSEDTEGKVIVNNGVEYVTHAPIRINSNADFDEAHGVVNWATGDGSPGNPWIIEGWDIDGTGYGYCMSIGNTTDYFIVRNCYLHEASGGAHKSFHWDTGLLLYFLQNGKISNNTIDSNLGTGISLYGADNTNVVYNNLSYNSGGIGSEGSFNSFINNSISHNSYGISLSYGDNNFIINNTISWNGAWGISVYSIDNINIVNNIIYNQLTGINLGGVNYSVIHQNEILNHTTGIALYGHDNDISSNNLYNNDWGITLDSDPNLIYHNNFISNTKQAYENMLNFWDNGYPSGGNYWSDYNGSDVFSGPNQDQPGSDGIGDTAYTNIEGGTGAQDNYPLMEPWGDVPDIWIYPTSFDFIVNEGDTGSQNLTIGNDHLGDLRYWITYDSYAFFSDNFDGEAEGTSPPVNWVESTIYPPLNCEVDDIHSYSSPHSMWLRSSAGGSGTVYHDVSFTSETYQSMLYFDSTNQRRNIVTQAVPGDLVGSEYCVYMQFDELGRIRYYDGSWKLTGYNYSTGWHKLEIAHDFINNTFDAWYDGIQILDNCDFWNSGKASIESIHIWVVSTGGDLWVDDVQIGSQSLNWFSVLPDWGILSPSTNTTHTVMINTTGLVPGFYQKNIVIESNDPDELTILIPVNLTVIPYQIVNISLDLSWNFISLPLEQSDESINEVLQSVDGKWDCVQYYDAIDSSWKSHNIYRPDSLNDLQSLNHLMGFWINITEPNVNLTVRGYIPSSTSIPLYAGWNLVGYPSLINRTVGDALWGTSADRVEVCDIAEPYNIREVGPDYVMRPGEGYWVHVPADTVWIVDW